MRTALVSIALLILTVGAAAAQSGFGDPKVEAITVSPRLPTAGAGGALAAISSGAGARSPSSRRATGRSARWGSASR